MVCSEKALHPVQVYILGFSALHYYTIPSFQRIRFGIQMLPTLVCGNVSVVSLAKHRKKERETHQEKLKGSHFMATRAETAKGTVEDTQKPYFCVIDRVPEQVWYWAALGSIIVSAMNLPGERVPNEELVYTSSIQDWPVTSVHIPRANRGLFLGNGGHLRSWSNLSPVYLILKRIGRDSVRIFRA